MCQSKVTSLFILVIAAALIAGVAGAQASNARNNNGSNSRGNDKASRPAASPAPVVVPTDPEYIIGPDDVLTVNVWKEPDLSRSAPVRPDGKITLPLIGDIEASGATPIRLQAKIEKGLAEFISKPSVTVIVQEARSHRFNIIGEVQRPGTYAISGPMTLLDAIALAGGFREWAKSNNIYILRPGPKGQQRIPVNYKEIIKGKAADIPLKIRDTVVVP